MFCDDFEVPQKLDWKNVGWFYAFLVCQKGLMVGINIVQFRIELCLKITPILFTILGMIIAPFYANQT